MTNQSRDEAEVRAMLQRRAADVHPSPGAWEAITARLGEPDAATVLPFRSVGGRRRALVGAAAAALVLVVGVGAFALAARDGEPSGVVAGPPDQGQPVTTVTGAPVPSGTPLQGVWPVATEEALLARPDAGTTLADPQLATAQYLSERLPPGTEWGLDELQQSDAQSGFVGYDTVDGLEGVVLLRRLGDEGGPWYVVAATSDVLELDAQLDGDTASFLVTSSLAGRLEVDGRPPGAPPAEVGTGSGAPVEAGGSISLTVGDGRGPAVVTSRLFGADGQLLALQEAFEPSPTVAGPDEEEAAPETTIPPTTVAPRTTTSTTSPVEDGAALGETTLVLEVEGLGFVGAGDDTTISRLGFGSDQDDVLAALTATLGAPDQVGTNEECPPGPAEVAQFADGFVATFQDGAFVGWAVQEPSTTTTAAGIGFGSTLADVQAAYAGITVEETSLGWELAGGDLYGIVSGPDAGDTVENLFGGTNCIFR